MISQFTGNPDFWQIQAFLRVFFAPFLVIQIFPPRKAPLLFVNNHTLILHKKSEKCHDTIPGKAAKVGQIDVHITEAAIYRCSSK